MRKEKAIFNWSGGKDSALALYKTLQAGQYDVLGLLTTLNMEHQRISMHGVRTELLDRQAASIGITSIKLFLPDMPDMETYEKEMEAVLLDLRNQRITVSIFGDIFLEDLRAYRENKLAALNIKAAFPLWKMPTDQLIREFLSLGFKTIVTCVDDKFLGKEFAGRIIDDDFLNALPAGVDPCGENGEFHTFVFDGPLFKEPVDFEKGDIIYRGYTAPVRSGTKEMSGRQNVPPDHGFWYCDLRPRI